MSSGEEEENRNRNSRSSSRRRHKSDRKSSSSSKRRSSNDRDRSSSERRSSHKKKEGRRSRRSSNEDGAVREENIFTRAIPAPPLAGLDTTPEKPRRRERRSTSRTSSQNNNNSSRSRGSRQLEDEERDDSDLLKSFSDKHGDDATLEDALEQCNWQTMYHLLTTRDGDEVQQFFLEENNNNNPESNHAFHSFLCKAPGALSLMLLDVLSDDALEELSQVRDGGGNAALHLLCANLERIAKPELILLIRLVDAAPRALQLPNQEGDAPLHLLVASPAAACRNHTSDSEEAAISAEKAVAVLLEETIEIAILQDSSGATPLHVALAHQAHDLVLLKLLEVAPVACKVPDVHGLLPLHYGAAVSSSSSSIAMEALLTAHPKAIGATTSLGDTPLHLWLSNYDAPPPPNMDALRCVELLAGLHREGPVPIVVANQEKLTPLHCCALFDCHPDITRTIMKHPAARKASVMTNKFGATALHMAVSQRQQQHDESSSSGSISNMDNIIALGTKEAAASEDRLKRSPLHVAAQNPHATSQLLQVLYDWCPKATTMATQRGHLPLHLAAQSQAPPHVVETLLELDPAAAQVRNKSNNTPLHNAAKYQADPAVVELLLRAFSDATYVQNQYGNLPLHCATAYQAAPGVISLLLQAWPDGAAMQNANQDAPLHYAAAYYTSDLRAIQTLIDAAPAAVLLLNSSGQSPLDRARANHAPEAVLELLEASADAWTQRAANKEWGEFDSSQGDEDESGSGSDDYE